MTKHLSLTQDNANNDHNTENNNKEYPLEKEDTKLLINDPIIKKRQPIHVAGAVLVITFALMVVATFMVVYVLYNPSSRSLWNHPLKPNEQTNKQTQGKTIVVLLVLE